MARGSINVTAKELRRIDWENIFDSSYFQINLNVEKEEKYGYIIHAKEAIGYFKFEVYYEINDKNSERSQYNNKILFSKRFKNIEDVLAFAEERIRLDFKLLTSKIGKLTYK